MGINIKNFNAAIQAARDADAKYFTMKSFCHRRGTPACVIGNLAYRRDLQNFIGVAPISGRIVTLDDFDSLYAYRMAEWFGIDVCDYHDCFGVLGCDAAQTPAEAVAYLEKFLADRLALEAKCDE